MTPGALQHVVDAQAVTERLAAAYSVLARLPDRSRPAAYRLSTGGQGGLEGWKERPVSRAPVPSPRDVALMDEALEWFSLLRGQDERVRRVVDLRARTSRETERALYDWRTLGRMLGCSQEGARQAHIRGIDVIVVELRRRLLVPGRDVTLLVNRVAA